MNIQKIQKQIQEQKSWIEQCGGNLTGYLKKYGDASKDREFYGDGGLAIFNADVSHLRWLESHSRRYKKVD